MRSLMMVATLAALLASPALAADDNGQVVDDEQYRIYYVSPKFGQVVPSPVKFVVKITGGYKIALEKACRPAGDCYGKLPLEREADAGHCHTYVENIKQPGRLIGFNARCDSSFTLSLPPGRYCAYADLTHHDHVARVKPGPQSFPGSDKTCFFVRPGR